MAAAPETPQVIEAACLPLRQDRLDKLLEQLEMCEKALQVCHDLVGGFGLTAYSMHAKRVCFSSMACRVAPFDLAQRHTVWAR